MTVGYWIGKVIGIAALLGLGALLWREMKKQPKP